MKFKRIKDLREDHDKFQKDIAQILHRLYVAVVDTFTELE